MARTVTFKGNPVNLAGPQLKPGDKAPDFQGLKGLDKVALADTPAKARLFSVVPSLDTGVCSMQTKKFDEGLKALGDSVASYTVSLDLPFAQRPVLHGGEDHLDADASRTCTTTRSARTGAC